MKNRKEINAILNKYDLVGIAECSNNEYDIEVKMIIKRIAPIIKSINEEKVAKIVYDVFVEMFDKQIIPDDKEIYKQIAKEIIALY